MSSSEGLTELSPTDLENGLAPLGPMPLFAIAVFLSAVIFIVNDHLKVYLISRESVVI